MLKKIKIESVIAFRCQHYLWIWVIVKISNQTHAVRQSLIKPFDGTISIICGVTGNYLLFPIHVQVRDGRCAMYATH